LPPARAEHAGLVDGHGAGAGQQRVQAGQHVLGQVLVDDEGEVEVVGGLRDQVHALAAELGPDIRELVQQRTHAAADQGDGGAGGDHLDPADFGEIGAKRIQDVGADQVVAGVERDGDVGFGGADQVYRQPVRLQ